MSSFETYQNHCGKTQWKKPRSLFDIDNADRDKLPWDSVDLKLPATITSDFPIVANAWLLQAGITQEIRDKYQIGYVWNEVTHGTWLERRIVLPVFEPKTKKLIGYQARSLDPITPERSKYKSIGTPGFFYANLDPTEYLTYLILVEDILSAIRLYDALKDTELKDSIQVMALLGTAFGDGKTQQVLKAIGIEPGKPYPLEVPMILIWLDPDQPGQEHGAHLLKRLNMYTSNAHFLNFVTKEPKQCYAQEIRDILKPYIPNL